MGASTETSTSTSGPSNKDLNNTLSKLSKGISGEYTPGKSLFQGPGATTQAGWASSLGAAGNPDFAGGIAAALKSFGSRAGGGELGMDAPGYAALRSKLGNDVMTGTNAAFNGSGLFGSDSNQREAGRGLAEALGGLDYSNYRASIGDQERAAGMLPGLFSAGQMPGAVQGAVGSEQDAAAQGAANGPTDYLAKLTAILGGMAGASPQTTTSTTPTTPWWQSALGLGIGLL